MSESTLDFKIMRVACTSNEYPQDMLLVRNKNINRNINPIVSYLELCQIEAFAVDYRHIGYS